MPGFGRAERSKRMAEELTVTEKLTGVIKGSSITEILEEVKNDMCDKYCKYPGSVEDQEELYDQDGPCNSCPLNRL